MTNTTDNGKIIKIINIYLELSTLLNVLLFEKKAYLKKVTFLLKHRLFKNYKIYKAKYFK